MSIVVSELLLTGIIYNNPAHSHALTNQYQWTISLMKMETSTSP